MACQFYQFNFLRDSPDPVTAVPVCLVGSRRGPVLMFLGPLRGMQVQNEDMGYDCNVFPPTGETNVEGVPELTGQTCLEAGFAQPPQHM